MAYIGVGSNIRPEHHVPAGLSLLAQRVTLRAVSTMYRTAPLGRPEQPEYRNGVWAIRTNAPPGRLRGWLKEIERQLGRTRQADPHAPRTLDLDLLLCGEVVDPDLGLPDPDIQTRAFVAVPLAEVAPTLRVPERDRPIADIAAELLERQGPLEPDRALTATLRDLAARLGANPDFTEPKK